MCIEGSHADGHHFIPHAISQGTNLIIAKLLVPGAELALYTDADPQNPDLKHLYQEPYYHMAENDALTMEACSDEMAKWYDKMQGFGQKNKLKEDEIEHLQMAGAMRCISSALNYNFDHWETFEGALPRHRPWMGIRAEFVGADAWKMYRTFLTCSMYWGAIAHLCRRHCHVLCALQDVGVQSIDIDDCPLGGCPCTALLVVRTAHPPQDVWGLRCVRPPQWVRGVGRPLL